MARHNPIHQYRLGPNSWKVALKKNKNWGFWWTTYWPCAFAAKRWPRKSTVSRSKEINLPLYSALVKHPCSAGSRSGLLRTDTQTYPSNVSQGTQRWSRHWSISYENMLRELVLFSLEKRKLKEILSIYINTRWGMRWGVKMTEHDSSQRCPKTGQEAMSTDWITGNSFQMEDFFFFSSCWECSNARKRLST